MAFESVSNLNASLGFKSTRGQGRKISGGALLSFSIGDEKNNGDSEKTSRKLRFILSEELMKKLNLFEKDLEFFIDTESNRFMLKLSKYGNKITTPFRNGKATTGRGYIKFSLPEHLKYLNNTSITGTDITEILEDGFIFNLPSPQSKPVIVSPELKKLRDKFYGEDGLNSLISKSCDGLQVTLLDSCEFKVINNLEGDIYKLFSYDELSMFIHGWTECLSNFDRITRS